MERENKTAVFDEIVLNIMPLLKNGVTPEAQTILTVLEDIADRIGEGWQLDFKIEPQFLTENEALFNR